MEQKPVLLVSLPARSNPTILKARSLFKPEGIRRRMLPGSRLRRLPLYGRDDQSRSDEGGRQEKGVPALLSVGSGGALSVPQEDGLRDAGRLLHRSVRVSLPRGRLVIAVAHHAQDGHRSEAILSLLARQEGHSCNDTPRLPRGQGWRGQAALGRLEAPQREEGGRPCNRRRCCRLGVLSDEDNQIWRP